MEDHIPTGARRSNRRAGIIGGVIGSVGLATALLAVTATAGATEPTLEAPAEDTSPVVVDDTFPDEEEWRAFDACVDAVFEAQGFEIDDAPFGIEVFPMDDGEFVDGVIEFGPEVSIVNGEVLSFAEFGEGDGSITITKNGDDLTVTTDGDVSVEEIDWDEAFDEFEGEFLDDEFDDAVFDELDEALEGCEDQLPEGIDFDGDVEFGEFDTEDDEDEQDEPSEDS